MNKKMTALQLSLIAMAVCINVAGGQFALMLRLPIYLDSVGTILIGAFMGPIYGMLPNLLSGLFLGMTTDIYSLYFTPVGMLVGFMTGILFRSPVMRRTAEWRKTTGISRVILSAVFIAVPGTLVSSVICAVLFGGITSSGSTILVQLLAKTPLGMTASIFLVQAVTDCMDRAISLAAVISIWNTLPEDIKQKWREKGILRDGCSARTIQ